MNIKEINSTYVENVNAEVNATDMIEKHLDGKVREAIIEKLEGIERNERWLIPNNWKPLTFQQRLYKRVEAFAEWILNTIDYIKNLFTLNKKEQQNG